MISVITVAGHLRVVDRDRFVALSSEAVRLARATEGCHDFVVAADPLDDDRVVVYERWTDRETMLAFRGDGPNDELGPLITAAAVEEFEIAR